jgi:hypothetical protein
VQHEIRFSTVLRIVATAAVAGSVVYGTALAQTPGPNTAAQAPAVPVPTNTPIYDIDHPPQSVAAPLAVDSCANDVFLAQRAIPAPTRSDVTVCGTVIAATAGAAFDLDVDGTSPIPIFGSNLGVHPGDFAIIHGRYNRSGTGADWIDGAQRVAAPAATQTSYVVLSGTPRK